MQFVTSKQASKRLGVHPNTLRRWANKGQIQIIKTKAGQRLYDVDTFIAPKTELSTIKIILENSDYKTLADYASKLDRTPANLVKHWVLIAMIGKGLIKNRTLEDLKSEKS